MSRRIRIVAACLVAVLFIIELVLLAERWAEDRAARATETQARTVAINQAGLLTSELQKFRLLPLVLAEYPDVRSVLAHPREDGVDRYRLDRALELLATRTDAAAIYVINRRGTTLAASNWRTSSSFVGKSYVFRPYFTEAMRHGSSELFALGTVSGRPGLYLARRIDDRGTPIGVVVVKVEFAAIEAGWPLSAGITLATDAHGVIIVTNRPELRFTTTKPLDAPTLNRVRRTLQFGRTPPPNAPLKRSGRIIRMPPLEGESKFGFAEVASPLADGRLIVLLSMKQEIAAARAKALILLLTLGLVALLIAVAALRSAERRRTARVTRETLEREVAARTAELRQANADLMEESAERAAAEHRFRDAREALAQANRLGMLGQIAAGVAHEINQPTAAVRAYAENGAALLQKGDAATAKDNFDRIVSLADRIGSITSELRNFARRRSNAVGKVPLARAFEGVRLLLGNRLGCQLHFDVSPDIIETEVVGDQIRLEQILVNLIQNAADALHGMAGGRIVVAARRSDSANCTITVSDNGPGIDPTIRDQLFTPFTSSKPNGLGLGLAIAQSIARDLGAELRHDDTATVGTHFILKVTIE